MLPKGKTAAKEGTKDRLDLCVRMNEKMPDLEQSRGPALSGLGKQQIRLATRSLVPPDSKGMSPSLSSGPLLSPVAKSRRFLWRSAVSREGFFFKQGQGTKRLTMHTKHQG